MGTVLITGGTGLIGKALSAMLVRKGYKVIILSRQPDKNEQSARVSYLHWDLNDDKINEDALLKADYIIHLAGANVAGKRWTKEYKKEIVESRTTSSTLLVKAIAKIPNKVKAVISASAIGWYGNAQNFRQGEGFKEDAPAANDFLGQVCNQWEQSIKPVELSGKRLVILRTGVVLSNHGGALSKFIKPLKFRTAAILSSGNQIISWIHIEDLCRIYIYAMENNISGIFNAVAPEPVSNKRLTLELARLVKGGSYIPVHIPSFILRMMLGEMSVEILKSATISADKIKREGFDFLYPDVEEALEDLILKR